MLYEIDTKQRILAVFQYTKYTLNIYARMFYNILQFSDVTRPFTSSIYPGNDCYHSEFCHRYSNYVKTIFT